MAKRKLEQSVSARKKRKIQSPHPNMICVVCLDELKAQDVLAHYTTCHPALVVDDQNTANLHKVISNVNRHKSTKLSVKNLQPDLKLANDDALKARLDAFADSASMNGSINNSIDFQHISLPQFPIGASPFPNSKRQAVVNGSNGSNGSNSNYQTSPHSLPQTPQSRSVQRTKTKRPQSARKAPTVSNHLNRLQSMTTGNNPSPGIHPMGASISNIGTAPAAMMVPNQKLPYQFILDTLDKFDSNRHNLSNLLTDDVIPNTLIECQSVIKVLFEQLWNARNICDEQRRCIEYQNTIDTGNRMQLQFILHSLQKDHPQIYGHLYRQLEEDEEWKKWKEVRVNDRQIGQLRQRIMQIRGSVDVLQERKENIARTLQLQRDTVSNLRDSQAANTQRLRVTMDHLVRKYNQITDAHHQSANRTMEEQNGNGQPVMEIKSNDRDESDEFWRSIIKWLEDLSAEMDVTEVIEKCKSKTYCTEFDVLNAVLQQPNVDGQRVKTCFTSHFGKLVGWSNIRLIRWCQTNKQYYLCQNIRVKHIDGSQFIEIASDPARIKHFWPNLMGAQVTKLQYQIERYLYDHLTVLGQDRV